MDTLTGSPEVMDSTVRPNYSIRQSIEYDQDSVRKYEWHA